MITLCAGQTTWLDVYASQPGGVGAFSYARDGFFMQVNVLDDSAWADVFPAEFELGFDENKEIRALLRASRSRSQYFADGNKGYVGDDKIDLRGDVRGFQFSRVPFDGDDAWILL